MASFRVTVPSASKRCLIHSETRFPRQQCWLPKIQSAQRLLPALATWEEVAALRVPAVPDMHPSVAQRQGSFPSFLAASHCYCRCTAKAYSPCGNESCLPTRKRSPRGHSYGAAHATACGLGPLKRRGGLLSAPLDHHCRADVILRSPTRTGAPFVCLPYAGYSPF